MNWDQHIGVNNALGIHKLEFSAAVIVEALQENRVPNSLCYRFLVFWRQVIEKAWYNDDGLEIALAQLRWEWEEQQKEREVNGRSNRNSR